MKKCLLLFVFVPLFTFSQSKINYYYDASGNRIQRVIVLQNQQAKRLNSRTNRDSFTESFGDRKVQITPSYSEGKLRVQVTKYKSDDCCNLSVYSSTGELIAQKNNVSYTTEFNLSNRINGIYLLKVEFNGNSTTWKIIKK